MTDTKVKPAEPAYGIYETPPFGLVVLTGKKGAGKTLTVLNSPWTPVHVIDTENSSKEYFQHMKKLIELGIISAPFSRAECIDPNQIQQEIYRIAGVNPKKPTESLGPGVQYGTISIDTCGQWSDWISDAAFSVPDAKKTGQIVWGSIRGRLRRTLLTLSGHCKLLLLTAHERKYNDVISPRCNPAIMEIAAISIRLQRPPNTPLPNAQFLATRIPFFPPQIKQFSMAKLLDYFEKPADWKELGPEDLIPEPVEEPKEEAEE